MMRCIENAIAANHITRSAGDELDKRVKTMLREGLAPPDVRERLTAELAAKEKLAKRRALLMEQRRKVLTEAVLTYKNYKGEIDPAEALWLLVENDGRGNIASVQRLWEAIRGKAQSEMEAFLHDHRKGWLTGDLRRDDDPGYFLRMMQGIESRISPRAQAAMQNVVRELFGEDSGNPHAKAFAKTFAEVAEKLRQRFNAAGGNIAKLPFWALPQSHDPNQLRAIGQGPWVEYLMRPGVLNRERMINHDTGQVLSDGELREALREVWKKITTDGWIDREPGYAAYGKGALARQADDKHRFLHFANADAWLAYQKAFKGGDPIEGMMGYVTVMSRDIATMEIFGPSPEIMRSYLKQLVLQHAATAEPLGSVVDAKLMTIADVMRRLVPGDAGERFIADLSAKLRALADAEAAARVTNEATVDERAVRASAGKAADDLARSVDDLLVRLKNMEPETVGAERARLTDRLFEVEAERAAVGAKEAPQVGVSKRNKRRLAALADEARDVQARRDAIDTGDNSLFVAEPQAYAEMVQAANDMRAAAKEIRAGGLGYVRNPGAAANKGIELHDSMWNTVRGSHFAPVDEAIADWSQGARNLQTGVLLGSAAIQALADPVFQRMARRMAGMDANVWKILGGYLSMFSQYDRREAVRAMLGIDAMIHVTHNPGRYGEQMLGPGSLRSGETRGKKWVKWSGYTADRVISGSGLSSWTQQGKWFFGTDFMGDAAEAVARYKTLADVPVRFQRTFKMGGFTEADWAALRATKLYDRSLAILEGSLDATPRWLRPNEIAQGPGGEALAEKYLMMIHTLTRRAVIEGTQRTRSIMDFGRPGRVPGEVGRFIFQFKSFGFAALINGIMPIVREFHVSGKREGSKLAAEYILWTTLMGLLVSELYEIVNLREPVLPRMIAEGKLPTPNHLLAWQMKGGGLGIWGDYALAPVDKSGQGLVATVAGPVVGQISKLRGSSFTEVMQALEEEEGKKKSAGTPFSQELVRSLVPGQNLWWLRGVKDRLILNQLHKWQDPEGFERVTKRHEKLQRKRLGNGYWWRPGDLYPGQSGQGGGGPRRM